jgi:hypothetical protein
VIDALRRLVGGVDVLVENFRPAIARLGLDYATLGAQPAAGLLLDLGLRQTGPS